MDTQTAVEAYRNDPAVAELANAKLQELLARSATDMPFRAKLVGDPRAAIAEFTGADPASLQGLNVRFVENSADATIVLPDFVDAAAELSEQELEAVAGGASPLVLATITLGIALLKAYQDGYGDGQQHTR